MKVFIGGMHKIGDLVPPFPGREAAASNPAILGGEDGGFREAPLGGRAAARGRRIGRSHRAGALRPRGSCARHGAIAAGGSPCARIAVPVAILLLLCLAAQPQAVVAAEHGGADGAAGAGDAARAAGTGGTAGRAGSANPDERAAKKSGESGGALSGDDNRASAGRAAAAAGAPKIAEEDLRREDVDRRPTPEWLKRAREAPRDADGTDGRRRSKEGSGGQEEGGGKDGPPEIIDITAGDIEAQWNGAFERSLRRSKGRMPGEEIREEVWKLEGNVQIEQQATGSALRAQKVTLVRDADSGTMKSLAAEGAVEVVTEQQKAKCERLNVEMAHDDKGAIVKNLYVLEGGGPAGKPATLWLKDDAIQAPKITLDRAAMSFRAEGGFVAVSDPAVRDPSPAAGDGAEGGASLAGIGIQPGKRIRIQADGPLVSEGREGRTHTSGNVLVRQEGLSITCDRLVLTHAPILPDDAGGGGAGRASPAGAGPSKGDPPETRGPEGAAAGTDPPNGRRREGEKPVPKDAASGAPKGLFAGDLRRIDAFGKVAIVTPETMIECDRVRYNMFRETIELDMDDTEKDVRIVLRDKGGKARLLLAKGGLVYDRKQDRMTPKTGGAMRIVPYREPEKK